MQKLDTSQKARQFAIRFYIQKPGTFGLRDFSLTFSKFAEGGGGIYIFKKKSTLRDIFISKKQCTLRYVAIQRA